MLSPAPYNWFFVFFRTPTTNWAVETLAGLTRTTIAIGFVFGGVPFFEVFPKHGEPGTPEREHLSATLATIRWNSLVFHFIAPDGRIRNQDRRTQITK
jgi:hypothetical protein